MKKYGFNPLAPEWSPIVVGVLGVIGTILQAALQHILNKPKKHTPPDPFPPEPELVIRPTPKEKADYGRVKASQK